MVEDALVYYVCVKCKTPIIVTGIVGDKSYERYARCWHDNGVLQHRSVKCPSHQLRFVVQPLCVVCRLDERIALLADHVQTVPVQVKRMRSVRFEQRVL